MKFEINHKILAAVLISGFAAFGLACQNQKATNSTTPTTVAGEGGTTPTDAYKKLYTAVKSKQTDAIKAVLSDKTVGFAQSVSQRQNQPVGKVYENGFTGTTFSDTMPEIRDERIKGDSASVEVYNAKDSRWEDLPFVKETSISFRVPNNSKSDNSKNNLAEIVRTIKGITSKENGDIIEGTGKFSNAKEVENVKNKLTEIGAEVEITDLGWKLAIGDLFAGTFESPGKGRAQIESDAANVNGNNLVPIQPKVDANYNLRKPINPAAANANTNVGKK